MHEITVYKMRRVTYTVQSQNQRISSPLLGSSQGFSLFRLIVLVLQPETFLVVHYFLLQSCDKPTVPVQPFQHKKKDGLFDPLHCCITLHKTFSPGFNRFICKNLGFITI